MSRACFPVVCFPIVRFPVVRFPVACFMIACFGVRLFWSLPYIRSAEKLFGGNEGQSCTLKLFLRLLAVGHTENHIRAALLM